jgi:hypothetical protein
MSRGLGVVERFVLDFLTNSAVDGWDTPAIVLAVTNRRKMQPSASSEASVRRALASLLRKGLIFHTKDEKTGRKEWKSGEGERKERERRARREAREAKAARKQAWREAQARARTKHVERQSSVRVLAKLLGLLGSEHDAEVLAAARKAEAERKRLGKTWQEILTHAGRLSLDEL